MILFLTLGYIGLLVLLVKLKIVPLNTFTKISPVLFSLLLLFLIFIPMQFTAPAGPAIVLKHAVQIVPNVSGLVTEVAVEAYTPVAKGDLLFKIEDRPYKAAVASIKAQLMLAERRLAQARTLAERRAGSAYEVEAAETQVDSLKAQLDAAEFNLQSTEVRAPADGHVTNLALREGTMLMSAPLTQAMAFVDESEVVIVASIHQINLRHVAPGQEAEVFFKLRPGEIFAATVEHVVADLATGQVMPGGVLPVPGQIVPAPYFVRLKLDDEEVARSLPTGAAGTAAIYTGEFEISYLIRRVAMRMEAWLAYIVPV
jgi:multidrug resistance efflux pump